MPDYNHRLARYLDEKGVMGSCESCGATNWTWPHDHEMVQMPFAGPDGMPLLNRSGLSVYPVMCTSCGFLRFYSAGFINSRT